MYDIAVIGGGPAGYSAAATARQRDKSVCVIRPADNQSNLLKAELVNNYIGLPAQNGRDLLMAFEGHARTMNAHIMEGVVKQIFANGPSFMISLGADFVEAKAVILATGVKQPRLLEGEEALVGRGVSYCGTCDGMLYKGKTIAVVAQSAEAIHETGYLAGLAESVLLFKGGIEFDALPDTVQIVPDKPSKIIGADRAEGIEANGHFFPADGIFIFRDVTAYTALIPGLALNGSFIQTDARMQTNIPGLFAAGDCTGGPLQVAKAVGEGNTAALYAIQNSEGSDLS